MKNQSIVQPRNKLLSAVPPQVRERLGRSAQVIALELMSVVYDLGDTVSHVYFPTSGAIALFASLEPAKMVEIGLVGREGMLGLSRFLGVEESPVQMLVYGAGSAIKIEADAFIEESQRSPELSAIMLRFTQVMLSQISQDAVCCRFHTTEKRLASWLLMLADRMDTNHYKVTQDLMSNMLGVSREGINRAAGSLKQQGLIDYSRGSLLVLDPTNLEEKACPCYRLILQQEAKLLNSCHL